MSQSSDDLGGLSAALSTLDARRTELNRLDDEYLALIARLEEALRALGFGLRVEHRMVRGFADGDAEEVLAFDKVGGTWRLVHEEGPCDADPDQWSATPVASCDRDLRFQIFAKGHVAELLRQILIAVERAISARTTYLEPSKALVAAVEQARPPRPSRGAKP